MKNTITLLTFKTLLCALVVGLFAGCAATRPIADTALGAGGAYLGHELSNGDPLATAAGAAGGVILSEVTSLRREEAVRQGLRRRLRQRKERRREATVLALRRHAEAAQPGRQCPPLPREVARTAN